MIWALVIRTHPLGDNVDSLRGFIATEHLRFPIPRSRQVRVRRHTPYSQPLEDHESLGRSEEQASGRITGLGGPLPLTVPRSQAARCGPAC